MKKNKLLLLISFIVFTATISCSKDDDAPTHAAPNWKVEDDASLAYSMTAVVGISDSIKQTVSNGDELAAFIGDECRGVGVYVERGNAAPVFYVLIKGAADESGVVSFKYYNAKSKHIYATENVLPFEIDDNYGTVDEPAIPELEPM